ncbi:MAG: hypothetical protein N2V78_03675 [Methanophagales archaeon]|nr:hypothetical protein [Methanophagales archaeon]
MKALISVFNKDNVIEFARALNELGIEVIATEGTAKEILKAGIAVTKVSAFTGFHAMLGGKVKTLHPRIHAGIATAEIGIVAVNLIPLDLDFSSENPLNSMDIGGVAMLRSGIKNFEHVAVIVNPARYDAVIEELGKKGKLSHDMKLSLAKEASEYILAYETKVNMIFSIMEKGQEREDEEAGKRCRWTTTLLFSAVRRVSEIRPEIINFWDHAWTLHVEGFHGARLILEDVKERVKFMEELVRLAKEMR